MDINTSSEYGLIWLKLSGRIDSITSNELDRKFKELILDGVRNIIVDCLDVNYISSAGIRIFISAQKQLKAAGGEIILLNMAVQVQEVFKVSGLIKAFRLFSDKNEIMRLFNPDNIEKLSDSKKINDISFNYIQKDYPAGKIFLVGSQVNLKGSNYKEEDVVSIKASDIQFGTGLGTIGDQYNEYKKLIGEAVIINNSFFYFPAVKKSSVDFILNSGQQSNIEYKFLHGFGFNGEYSTILSFNSENGAIDLKTLANSITSFAKSNLFGIVILAESKGFFGMNLKRIPLTENKPLNNKEIFDNTNFAEWVNFPIDADDVNNIILGTGIITKDRNLLKEEYKEIISEESNFHLHGMVLSKEPFNNDVNVFEKEIGRIMNELEIKKVQHLLGQTRFSQGLIGIIELEA